MERSDRTIWHYAVRKGNPIFYDPACMSRYETNMALPMNQQGMTVIRGDVNCDECKRMMGMV